MVKSRGRFGGLGRWRTNASFAAFLFRPRCGGSTTTSPRASCPWRRASHCQFHRTSGGARQADGSSAANEWRGNTTGDAAAAQRIAFEVGLTEQVVSALVSLKNSQHMRSIEGGLRLRILEDPFRDIRDHLDVGCSTPPDHRKQTFRRLVLCSDPRAQLKQFIKFHAKRAGDVAKPHDRRYDRAAFEAADGLWRHTNPLGQRRLCELRVAAKSGNAAPELLFQKACHALRSAILTLIGEHSQDVGCCAYLVTLDISRPKSYALE